ncbi:hypothetical protein ES703_82690 [subsurface metagenome]
MKTAVDALGSDYAPDEIVKEATEARDILVKRTHWRREYYWRTS